MTLAFATLSETLLLRLLLLLVFYYNPCAYCVLQFSLCDWFHVAGFRLFEGMGNGRMYVFFT